MIIKLSKDKNLYLFHKVSALDIALSIKQFAIMLKSGLGIDEVLDVLSQQTPDAKLNETYKKILVDVKSGMSVAESMKKHSNVFSDVIISIINIGEQGATLERNLDFLAGYLKSNYELQRKIKGATVYPMIIIAMTFLEMIGVIYFILPKLDSLFSSFDNTPAFTLFIMNGAGFIRENGLIIAGVAILLYIIIGRLLTTRAGKIFKDNMALKFPVIKKLNQSNLLATFSRTVGILLESGVPIEKALQITEETIGNSVYEKVINKISKEVKAGKSLAEALMEHPKMFSISYAKMIQIGENSGSLEENLEYLYDLNSEEVQEMSNNLTTLLEPILLIIIGGMIALLAITIIGPIYQLTGNLNA